LVVGLYVWLGRGGTAEVSPPRMDQARRAARAGDIAEARSLLAELAEWAQVNATRQAMLAEVGEQTARLESAFVEIDRLIDASLEQAGRSQLEQRLRKLVDSEAVSPELGQAARSRLSSLEDVLLVRRQRRARIATPAGGSDTTADRGAAIDRVAVDGTPLTSAGAGNTGVGDPAHGATVEQRFAEGIAVSDLAVRARQLAQAGEFMDARELIRQALVEATSGQDSLRDALHEVEAQAERQIDQVLAAAKAKELSGDLQGALGLLQREKSRFPDYGPLARLAHAATELATRLAPGTPDNRATGPLLIRAVEPLPRDPEEEELPAVDVDAADRLWKGLLDRALQRERVGRFDQARDLFLQALEEIRRRNPSLTSDLVSWA
jgi:tetratricopeptide (TPR) repeat protein